MIADMATDLSAARFLAYHAAWLKDQKQPFGKEASMAKLFATEAAMKHTTQAVQIHGGYGYIKGVKVERLMRGRQDRRNIRRHFRSPADGDLRKCFSAEHCTSSFTNAIGTWTGSRS